MSFLNDAVGWMMTSAHITPTPGQLRLN